MNVVRCDPLELPTDIDADKDLSRADLVFYGVDHSGPSYEALVYVDAGEQEHALGHRDVSKGYAGSFTVFGHDGCYGDEGHCATSDRYVDEFDRRPTHPLTPLTKAVIATDVVRNALRAGKSTITITVVSVVPESGIAPGTQEPLKFDSVKLLTYEG